jgi:endonuclease/exonuclease/phosphatase family metal-dependent hydrolase
MQILLEAGLLDLCNEKNAGYTVPTPLNTDEAHIAKMRLDYILVNKAFERFRPRVKILRNKELEILSDHYPVECTCQLK